MLRLMTSDDLRAKEDDVFAGLMQWARVDREHREGSLGVLLPLLRSPYISPQFMIDVVGKDELMQRAAAEGMELFRGAFTYQNGTRAQRETLERSVKRRRGNEQLYVVGGRGAGNSWLSSVVRYNAEEDRWDDVAAMATARSSAGVCVLDGKLYAVGGRDAGGYSVLSSAERYSAAEDRWEDVAAMSTARNGAGVGVLDGKLYAVGGYGGGSSSLSSVVRYSAEEDSWEAAAALPSKRAFAGVGVLD